MEYSDFSLKMKLWYQGARRELPWRDSTDPYKIWLSEIILQQTRVNQGMPYYLRFIEAFPSVEFLANAPEDAVLRLWQGLGYYSRAKNLHNCAKVVVEKYGSRFPSDHEELLKLPGVGPYTAAAIASIAFGIPQPVVDGNVLRVMSRYLGLEDNIADAATARKIRALLLDFIDHSDPGLFNQALMELGAMVCTPRKPECPLCPLAESCYALAHKKQDVLPVKQKNTKRRERHFYYWVLVHQGRIAMRKRGTDNIWKGLYEFYLVERPASVAPEQAKDDFIQNLLPGKTGYEIHTEKKHVLSHQDIFSHYLVVNVSTDQKNRIASETECSFYSSEETRELPKPILIDKFLCQKFI